MAGLGSVTNSRTVPWDGGEVGGEGLVLRGWTQQDVPVMVAMFDTVEMDRWTPLAHPFGDDVASSYVTKAREVLSHGMLQLAVTDDGGEPLGEVLLFGTDEPGTCEFAYAIGAAHRGRSLAARAVRAAGFTRASDPLVRREATCSTWPLGAVSSEPFPGAPRVPPEGGTQASITFPGAVPATNAQPARRKSDLLHLTRSAPDSMTVPWG